MPKNYDIYLKGTVGGWNFSADMVSYVLDKNKGSEVRVLIDSLGGDVATALSISSLFQNHGNVSCHYVGMSASAATIASMGAKRITIDANALFLVHKCLVPVLEWDYFNADELEAHIADLEKLRKDSQTVDGCIAGVYAQRCRKPKDDLLALMAEGAWLTAQQAKDWGFVDEITNQAEDPAPVLTDSVVSVLAEAGVPLPPLDAKRGSLLERLMRAISDLISRTPATSAATDTPVNETIMPKTFTRVEAAIGETPTVDESSVTLTIDAADKIEAALEQHESASASHAAELAARDEKIAELEARVAELEKEPAASTTPVVEKPEQMPDADKVAEALLRIIP